LGSAAKKPDHRKRIIFRPDPEIAVAPHDWISSSILQPFVTGVIVPHSVIVFVLCGNLHLLTIIKQQHDLLLSIVRGQNNPLPFDSCITILWKIECYLDSMRNNPGGKLRRIACDELGGIATAVFAELVQQLIHVVFRKVFPTSFLIIERFTRKQSEKAQSFDRV
jgi:hypothetical protein